MSIDDNAEMPSAPDTRTLSDIDMAHLQLKDEDFKAFTWSEICEIIKSGHVELFRRWPSDLAKYHVHKARVLQHYESLEKYVLTEKLHWSDPPTSHSPIPYTDPQDYQIRHNDHPYAFAPGITHLVVWSACHFPATMDKISRHTIYNGFVEKHFSAIPREQRVWFVNWGALQSVPGLEHFHILLKDMGDEVVQRIIAPTTN